MIAFDTNLVVRLALDDDPEQYGRVLTLVAEAERAGETILIQVAVICEMVWVLTRSYGTTRRDAAVAVRDLLDDARFVVERRTEVGVALERFEKGRGDFADYLIGEVANAEGARTTMTFDRALRREPGFTLL